VNASSSNAVNAQRFRAPAVLGCPIGRSAKSSRDLLRKICQEHSGSAAIRAKDRNDLHIILSLAALAGDGHCAQAEETSS